MFNVDDNLKVVVRPEVESDYLKKYNNKSFITRIFTIKTEQNINKLFILLSLLNSELEIAIKNNNAHGIKYLP